MIELGIPSKLVRLTKATMCNIRSAVRNQGELREVFQINKGLKQGDGLAPMLFEASVGRGNKKNRSRRE